MRPGTDREPALLPVAALELVRGRVDEVLDVFLASQREELAGVDPEGGLLIDELRRVIAGGGKRLRPAFCYWGHRAAGAADAAPIVRAAAALELLHTFAIVHDDVMDDSPRRRGVPSSHVHLAEQHRRRGMVGDHERYGRSVAILAGDLAAVLADHLLVDSGFAPDALLPALERYDRMRTEMAVGQLLDLGGAGHTDERTARRVASLKTGSYTVEGPLLIGVALAGGSPDVAACLSRYGRPLGQAFQLRDDILDGDAAGPPESASGPPPRVVDALVNEACDAIDPSLVGTQPAEALRSLARALRLEGT